MSDIGYQITELLSILRLLSADCFQLPGDLAKYVGCSVTRVRGLLSRAGDYGLQIEYHETQGYRLLHSLEWLDQSSLQAAIPTDSVIRLQVVEETESTNQCLLANPQHGSVLVAEWQHGGRGRMLRPWLGMLGGSLLFSVAWTFPIEVLRLSALPLVVGAVLADTLAAVGVTEIRLKWPNDLILPLGKVGGVLVEARHHTAGWCHAIVGVGLNLYFPTQWQSQLDQPVTALYPSGLQLGRNMLLVRFLKALESAFIRFSEVGFSGFSALWETYHLHQNQKISFRAADGHAKIGKILGATEAGLLRVGVPQEGEVHIHSSEALFKKQADHAAFG